MSSLLLVYIFIFQCSRLHTLQHDTKLQNNCQAASQQHKHRCYRNTATVILFQGDFHYYITMTATAECEFFNSKLKIIDWATARWEKSLCKSKKNHSEVVMNWTWCWTLWNKKCCIHIPAQVCPTWYRFPYDQNLFLTVTVDVRLDSMAPQW